MVQARRLLRERWPPTHNQIMFDRSPRRSSNLSRSRSELRYLSEATRGRFIWQRQVERRSLGSTGRLHPSAMVRLIGETCGAALIVTGGVAGTGNVWIFRSAMSEQQC